MNYNNYSKKNPEPKSKPEVKNDIPDTCIHVQANVVPIEPEVSLEPEVTKEVFGVVTDCEKLNIREEPDRDAEIVTVVTKGTVLKIDIDNFDGEWIPVCMASGIQGFCMADYIEIKD